MALADGSASTQTDNNKRILANMTKKNFIALANALKHRLETITAKYSRSPLYLTVAQDEHHETVRSLADFCATQNSQFKRERWIGYINDRTGGESNG